MDDLVRQAMAKWPNVPDCHGWLGLDGRGQWWMRDDRAQAAGTFQSGLPHSKGSLLRHEKLMAFIGRNYACDATGCWYFQNGPQRVYVELELTPWIWRIDLEGQVHSHTGMAVDAKECLLDEKGRLYLVSAAGLGLVHTQDVGLAADWIEAGRWTVQDCDGASLAQRFGYVTSPQSRQARLG